MSLLPLMGMFLVFHWLAWSLIWGDIYVLFQKVRFFVFEVRDGVEFLLNAFDSFLGNHVFLL